MHLPMKIKKIFHSLAIVPLMAPIWSERPPLQNELRTERPVRASRESVDFLIEGLDYLDARLHRRLLHNLGDTNHAAAENFLLSVLEGEHSHDLKAAAISQLPRLPRDNPEETARTVIPLLNHEDSRIRYWSHHLLSQLPTTEAGLRQILVQAQDDAKDRVRQGALRALQTHARHLQFADIYELTQTAESHLRAEAWAAALATQDAEENQEIIMQAAETDDSPLTPRVIMLQTAEHNLKFESELRQKMAEHSHASVRWAAAASADDVDIRNLRSGKESDANLFQVDQRVLLRLTDDEDAEVRRAAVKSLRNFPGPETLEKTIARFTDDKGFVRRESEETIVTLHRSGEPVTDLTAKQLTAKEPNARYHSVNVLGRIEAEEFSSAIHQLLKQEDRTEIIAAAILALTRLQYQAALPTVVDYHQHPEETVRRAAAQAFGIIADRSAYPHLAALILDPSVDVRLAAITSAGQLRDPVFAPPMLTILRDTRNTEPSYTAQDRMAVCWAAPRLRPLPEDIMDRIRRHALETVVRVPMGPPMHDDPEVMASAVFAFAEAAKTNQSYLEELQELNRRFTAAAEENGRVDDEFASQVTNTPILMDIKRQTLSWVKNDSENLSPLPAPTREPTLIYQRTSR